MSESEPTAPFSPHTSAHHKDLERMRKSKSLSHYSVSGHLIPAVKVGKCLYQPTYRLVPQRPLHRERLENQMKRLVNNALTSKALTNYSMTRGLRFCSTLARQLQIRTSQLQFDRYRLVSVVTMITKSNQSGCLKVGFMWDAELDTWFKYDYEGSDFYLSAVIYAIYYE